MKKLNKSNPRMDPNLGDFTIPETNEEINEMLREYKKSLNQHYSNEPEDELDEECITNMTNDFNQEHYYNPVEEKEELKRRNRKDINDNKKTK